MGRRFYSFIHLAARRQGKRAGVNESGALTAAAAEPLELSRNGQRFTQQALFDQRADVHGLRLRLYAPPNVTRLAPATGPLGGGTQVSVDGHGHAAGVDYRCRFGNATVPATFDEHAGLGCTAPAWSAAQVCPPSLPESLAHPLRHRHRAIPPRRPPPRPTRRARSK